MALPSTATFESACTGASGNLVPTGIGLSCDNRGALFEIFVNDQECVPSNCTAEEYGDYLEGIEDDLQATFEQALGVGRECTVNIDDEKVTTAGGRPSLQLAVVGIFGVLTVFFC